MEQHVCNPGGTPKFVIDNTANDSDKTFTVPTGKRWFVTCAKAYLVTTATVGNRVLAVQFRNASDLPIHWVASSAVAASKTALVSLIAGGPFSSSASGRPDSPGNNVDVANAYPLPGPGVWLPAGYYIRAWDTAAVDAAADDLSVIIDYVEYDV